MNKVIITGNIGHDPVINQNTGRRFCTFSIAHTEKWKNKTTGASEERTEWFGVIASGDGLIDKVIVPYFKRGTKLLVEGKLRCRKSKDKDTGKDKTYYSIELEHFELIGKPALSAVSTAPPPAAAPAPAPPPAPQPTVETAFYDASEFADFDVPF